MHGNNAVANKSGNLIVFAWGAELFGIALGVANSISLTFPKSLPENLFGWLPVLPVAILAAFELLRIPLAQAFQQAQQFMPRLLALIAMIALVGIALENWTLGLERTLNQRIHQAEQFRADHQDAQRAIAAREEANRRTKGALETEVLSARQELEVIETQIAAEHRRHVDNMERVKDCLKLVIVCYQAELNKENQRYDEAKKSLSQRRDGAGHRIATASASLVELGNGPIFGTDEGIRSRSQRQPDLQNRQCGLQGKPNGTHE
jgi:hypothetical protein